MDKVKEIFADYYDTFGYPRNTNLEWAKYYDLIIDKFAEYMATTEFSVDDIENEVKEISFWLVHRFGNYETEPEFYFMDIDGENLPSNFPKEKLDEFRFLLDVVIDHYRNYSELAGRKSPISFDDFKFLFDSNETLIIKVPEVFLNT